MERQVFLFDRLDSCVALTVTDANLVPQWSGALTMPQDDNIFQYRKALLKKYFAERKQQRKAKAGT